MRPYFIIIVMTLIFSCSTKKDNPNFSEKKIQASDSITYSFVNTYLKKIDSLKLYSDTSFHSDYREYPQIRFHIKTIKPHLYKLAFIEIIKNDSADSEVFIFKLNNKNWEYQQTIKSGCRYLFEIFEADVNFDNQNELIIQRAMGGSRSILDHLCFQFNNQTNEIGKHIITITSAYDLELDPKTKSIYIREDGANWYQTKSAMQWKGNQLVETKALVANFINDENSEYKYLFEVYDPNTKKDIYLEGDKMYEFLEKWR